MYRILLACLLLAAACNNTELQNTGNRSDTSMQSIDSSAIINEDSRLPRDSTATGVQH
jgi:hypothetical protein